VTLDGRPAVARDRRVKALEAGVAIASRVSLLERDAVSLHEFSACDGVTV
jgi:hypothetical protein